jgi:hypothetical protein
MCTRGDGASPRGDAASLSVAFLSCSTCALGLCVYVLDDDASDADAVYLLVYVVAVVLAAAPPDLLHRASRCARCSRSFASRSSAFAVLDDASVDATGRDASAEV